VGNGQRQLAALRNVAERVVTVADLGVPRPWGPQLGDSVREAHDVMRSASFDVAPLLEEPVRRYVLQEDLAGAPSGLSVEHLARDLRADDLVASALPLADALELLEQRLWYFMLEGNKICGILTTADLQMLPVSVVVLGFVLAVEAGIDELIEHHVGAEWTAFLSKERLEKVDQVFEERRSRNAETTRRACLNLDDRLTIACKDKAIRSALGASRTYLERSGTSMKRLRNTLAHGDSLLDVANDPVAGIAAAREAREFADRISSSLPTASDASGAPAAPSL
jgi:hypothetical protein